MSSTVAVLVDSSCDLSVDQLERYGLHVHLLTIHFAGRDWLDHLELEANEMFGILQIKADLPAPEIKVPRSEQYLATVERLLQTHAHVLALHSSPLIGRVYGMAFRSSEALPGKLTVVSSGATSGGTALQAIRARKLLDKGCELAEVIDVLAVSRRHQTTRICVTSLDGFKRAGIIGTARAFVGELRGVKPIIGVREGRLEVVTTVQRQEVAQEWMVKDFRERVGELTSAQVIFGYNGDPDKLCPLREAAAELKVKVVEEVQFGAVLSSIAGPDAYGFSLEPQRVWYDFREY